MIENKLGNFLNELRRENGLTQKELAELVHMSPSTISKWETGAAKPDVEVYDELAKVLNVSSLELFYCRRLPEDSTPQYLETLTEHMKELIQTEKKRGKKLFFQNVIMCVLAVMLAVSLVSNVHLYYTLAPRMNIVDEYYGDVPEPLPYQKVYHVAVEYDGRITTEDTINYPEQLRSRYKHHFEDAEAIIVTYYSKYKGREVSDDYYAMAVLLPEEDL